MANRIQEQALELSEVTGNLAQCCLAKEIELFSRFKLSSTEGQVMLIVHRNQPVLPSVVADKLGVVRSRITPLVQSLCEKGFLNRDEGASDRRTRMLTLTEAGKQAAEKANELHVKFHERLLKKFPDVERERLLSVLQLLQQRMMETRRDMQGERV